MSILESKYFKWFCLAILVIAIFFIVFVLFSQSTKEESFFSLNLKMPFIKNQMQIKSAPKETNQEVSLIAVGDIMLSRVVGQKMIYYQDYKYPFLKTADFLREADLTIGNLESPFLKGKPVLTGSFSFRADPESVEGLNYAGFDVVSLANNHILNQGLKGLEKTAEILWQNKIEFVGADLEQGYCQPIILEKNNLKIAFLAYTDANLIPISFRADLNHKGVTVMSLDNLKKDIENIRNKVDLIIVLMHSGTEYTALANKQQIELAHSAIDSGADLIIGSHAHWIQNIEQYQGKYIFYSLGNFVFDQMWSQKTCEGLAVKFYLDKNGVKNYELYPVIIEDYSQPRWASEEEKERIIQSIKN